MSQPRRQTGIHGSHCLHVFLCAKVSDEYIVASCPLCDCLEDQPASFIVPCNVALDHVSVSAAPQEMAARILLGAGWAGIGGGSPQPPNVWHLSDIGHVHAPQLTIAGFQDIAQDLIVLCAGMSIGIQ